MPLPLAMSLANLGYTLLTIAGIGFLMFVHEGGHHLAARWAKMRVIRFSIGMGPVLFSKTSKRSGTVYQVAIIPFLAYVLIDGMNPLEENDPDDPGLFCNKSVFQRMVVIFAGPLANYLAACVLAAVVVLTWGVEERMPGSNTVVAQEVVLDGAADDGGMRAGDRIVAIDGIPIRAVEEVRELTQARAGRTIRYDVLRDGRPVALTITPATVDGMGRIGVIPGYLTHRRKATATEVAKMVVIMPARVSLAIVGAVRQALTRGSTDELGSVVQIARVSARQAEQGAQRWLEFIAGLSISLGVLNLLPLPALDGGRLVFLFYEALLRRKVNARVETSLNALGMVTLLGFMLWITFRDIAKQIQ